MKILWSARSLEIDGPMLLEPEIFRDERGVFVETYQRPRYAAVGIPEEFVQDNYSFSHQGVLRGLHIQAGQSKLVRCTQGTIFDVVVDLRRSSPQVHWRGEVLSHENRRQLYVPPGFAHGFFVMSVTASVEYKCSAVYSPSMEHSVAWNDPLIGIEWPMPAGDSPILSERDERALTLREHQADGRFTFSG
jgi:dTDP-4-dehydrorhamnose 3,5-epimerase